MLCRGNNCVRNWWLSLFAAAFLSLSYSLFILRSPHTANFLIIIQILLKSDKTGLLTLDQVQSQYSATASSLLVAFRDNGP